MLSTVPTLIEHVRQVNDILYAGISDEEQRVFLDVVRRIIRNAR